MKRRGDPQIVVGVFVASIAVVSTSISGFAWDAPPPVPRSVCGPGAHPERGLQGRVSLEDIQSGYASDSIRCNADLVGRFGSKVAAPYGAGGFKVFRYTDAAGHECAFYDSASAFLGNAAKASADGTGVYVLDMSDPANPIKTANLTTPAMLSPHESLSFNAERGLLVAVAGFFLNPGIVDVYDASQDCRHPVLRSSTPLGIRGHEGNLSPDGKTFWASSGGEGLTPTLTAIDISDADQPALLGAWTDYFVHGFSLSDDGTRLFTADLDDPLLTSPGLRIIDVSEVQARVPSPSIREISRLTWTTVSGPSMTIPITVDGHPYLIEVDEYARGNANGDPNAPIGGARIVDIADETQPFVVSDIRLEVHQPENVATVADDPGARSPVGGYASHYCSVPHREDPGILACGFILSGLRVFDITDPFAPKEIAYFIPPLEPEPLDATAANNIAGLNAAFTMSAPSIVPERREIWFSDGNAGFFNVRIAAAVWPESHVERTCSRGPIPHRGRGLAYITMGGS